MDARRPPVRGARSWPEMPVIAADPERLQILLDHLIENSLKFRSDEAPRIEVSLDEEETRWVIHVSDNGIGIDEAFREHIFGLLTKLHGSDRYDGTGIGLALCRRIAELHGGEIWVGNKQDRGAIVHVAIAKNPASSQSLVVQ